jgi:hypothetical protein
MSWAGRAALSFGVALCGFSGVSAYASTMGSLAPRSPDGQQSRWIADPRAKCLAVDSDFEPGDGIAWQGSCAAGMISGPGTLTFLNKGRTIETITGTFSSGLLEPGHVTALWADGSKFDGDQSGGLFEGTGVFASATGERAEGEWKAGALNGKASVVWANGDRYDGEWKDGQPEGQGTEIWANGNQFVGQWRNGKPVSETGEAREAPASADPTANQSANAQAVASATQPDIHTLVRPDGAPRPLISEPAAAAEQPDRPTVAASAQKPIDAAKPAAVPQRLQPFMGTTLFAVDGSSISLNATEDGFSRLVSLPNGNSQQTSFAFMSDRIGTISNETAPIGLFRTSATQLDVNYTDGSVETIKPDTSGGLLVTLHGADGNVSCTAWYPQGHVFSQEEKKAAVQQFANRLGVAPPAGTGKHRNVNVAQPCGGAWLASVPTGAAAAAGSVSAPTTAPARAADTAIVQHSSPDAGLSPLTSASNGLQAVPVKSSVVHLVDTPSDSSANPGHVEKTNFASDEVPSARPPPGPDAAASAPPSSNASTCLSVTSNGEYWGFQNRCDKAVQFAYCEMSDSNPLTSCHRTSVAGSVAANGFSSLVGDRSLSEQGVKHDFRWMACEGGAGEVVPHLDSIDPPAGRCERLVPTPD